MPVPFSGGCACGAIRYSCASKPRYMGNCHCRDCQQATGGAFFAAVVVNASDSVANPVGLKSRQIEAISCDGRSVQTVARRCL